MNFSTEVLQQYCVNSGIPPLFVSMEAGKIQEVLDGKIPSFSHQELIRRLNREKRFPSYHIGNEGIYMSFQDYVGPHQERLSHIGDYVGNDIERLGISDAKEFRFGLRYHDAPEGISVVGDIPTPIKESFRPEVRKVHDVYESRLLAIVTGHILDPEITGFSRADMERILFELGKKETLRAQLSSYFDKLEAAMTCLLEIEYNNNPFFIEKLKWYINFLKDVKSDIRLPKIAAFLKEKNSTDLGKLGVFVALDEIIGDFERVVLSANPKEEVKNIRVYGMWKAIVETIPTLDFGGRIFSGADSLRIPRQ